MNYENTHTKLKALVAEILEVDSEDIADDAVFKDKYGADSITGLEILAAIEAEFGIHLPESHVEQMTDMNSIYAMMQELPAETLNGVVQ
ncbi:acyl carrier protein [Erwinia pyrifoliae]|uniref:acyl carrier protein n=1 Tax=Erwinia pyrifoliae TaxID=79967 RepID=UPI002207DF56|nr:acyl carrier protein [Erwinia pyrifoliae]MCT2386074.1 acyl carrier protein [Erwinia pyrifoliae]UWS29918.1 acyl carrier protein [Erwinia pyrifoliae]UXK12930.1 acyl carrier protein [Erwinia pyrifoliae]